MCSPTSPRTAQGLAQQTLDADDLRQFFVEQLIDTLRGSSPQLIGYRRGTLRGSERDGIVPGQQGRAQASVQGELAARAEP